MTWLKSWSVHTKLFVTKLSLIQALISAWIHLPNYIRNRQTKCSLRNDNSLLLSVPAARSYIILGNRAFSYSSPYLWNRLQNYIRNSQPSYHSEAKTFFCSFFLLPVHTKLFLTELSLVEER